MVNKAFILLFLFYGNILYSQSEGIYCHKKNNTYLEIYNDSLVKFHYLALGSMDSVIGVYSVCGKRLVIKYSRYNFTIEPVKCEGGNFGVFIEDNLDCFYNRGYVNDELFYGNFISFDNLLSNYKGEMVNLNIENFCAQIQFRESFKLINNSCYKLSIEFHPQPFDFDRFSEVKIKNKYSLIVDGVKYKRK